MSQWNKISNTIPKINTYVYMLGKDFEDIGYGKLMVFLDSMTEEDGFFEDFDEVPSLTEGDIFWMMYGKGDIDNNVCWDSIENFPYWITEENLLEFLTDKQDQIINSDETDRFDMLDL